jgi:KDO2-lipid IV(A) lauroyltransferase
MNNWVEYVCFRILLTLLRLFPFSAVQRLGSGFGWFVYTVIGFRRSLTLDNLRHAFPDKSEAERTAIALASYRNLFITFFEIACIDTLSATEITGRITFSDAEAIRAIIRRGKGLIILTGHFGNWEMNAIATPLFVPHDYTIVVQEQRNPYVNDFMMRMRSRFGTNLVYMKHAFRNGLKALRENGVVALIADQSGPESGIFVDFFGRPASTHQGPAVFQVRSGAPMIIIMYIRQPDGTARLELEEIDTGHLSGDQEKDIQTITERHVKSLERFVRRYPDQWLWMHKRWKHTERFLQRQQEGVPS